MKKLLRNSSKKMQRGVENLLRKGNERDRFTFVNQSLSYYIRKRLLLYKWFAG